MPPVCGFCVKYEIERKACHKHAFRSIEGAPTEIRTPVLALKGLRPGPLDDGGWRLSGEHCNTAFHTGQANFSD